VFPAIADAMFLKDIAVIQAAVDLTTASVNRVTEFIRLPGSFLPTNIYNQPDEHSNTINIVHNIHLLIWPPPSRLSTQSETPATRHAS
jgi:hypothetical protein